MWFARGFALIMNVSFQCHVLLVILSTKKKFIDFDIKPSETLWWSMIEHGRVVNTHLPYSFKVQPNSSPENVFLPFQNYKIPLK